MSDITVEALTEVRRLHDLWRAGKPGGKRADLEGANLRDANLRDANLAHANLRGANLTRADLTDANLTDAHLIGADLTDANLTDAHLIGADLSAANLTDADLAHANLAGANLTYSILTYADLTRANLTDAKLTDANLTYANLTCAILAGADLTYTKLTRAKLEGANLAGANLTDADLAHAKLGDANLSRATGLLNASDGLANRFERHKTEAGYVVYKAFGETDFGSEQKSRWPKVNRTPSYVLTETVNPERTDLCGSGVNFGTLKWIKANYAGKRIDIWSCLLADRDLADCVVPYNTDGKARCGRLTLIELVES